MKHYEVEQRVVAGQSPAEEHFDLATITVQHPVTGAVHDIVVRRVGPVPRELVQQALAENREALEQLAPDDGSASNQ
jgi:hypothetical protein